MFSIELESACLLELLKSSLFSLSPNISTKANWDRVYELAKAQGVVSLVASSVPKDHRSEWLKVSFQNKAHYMQMLYEQNALVSLFNMNHIPFVIIKGTAAAIYYPAPSLRTFGDIDFYISERYFKPSMDLLYNHGYKFVTNNYRQFEFKKNGVDIELHTKFSSKNYNDIEHILLEGLNNAVEYKISNSTFPGLPTYENGLVLLGHIMQHLKDSGIGLRQIVDWMMFVHNFLDDLTWEEHFRAFAIEAGLEKLAITVTYMCKKWIGLPDDISWCNSADDSVADQLLIQVLEDGNLGQDRALYEIVKRSMKNEGTFNYLMRSGVDNWRLAQKHRVFRPFAWIYQICRYAFLGVSGLVKGRKIFKNDKQQSNLEELLNKLE